MPYLYSAAVAGRPHRRPMMRALLVDSPDDPAAWTAELEYRLGRDLLVAPVYDPDGERHVYLPAGRWVDYWTGEISAGGRHVRVRSPLEQIPLYVRHGALIATTPVRDTVGAGPFREVTVVSWGAVDATTTVHDVDSDTVIRLERVGEGTGQTRSGSPWPGRCPYPRSPLPAWTALRRPRGSSSTDARQRFLLRMAG